MSEINVLRYRAPLPKKRKEKRRVCERINITERNRTSSYEFVWLKRMFFHILSFKYGWFSFPFFFILKMKTLKMYIYFVNF